MHDCDLDVLVVGAGLSGIAAGYHLQTQCPGKRYEIYEARGASGGTWDLFRYPGIRSDSDMYTLGLSFRPWRDPKAIADGPAILKYIRETAQEFGIDRKIRYDREVRSADWDSEAKCWRIIAFDKRTNQEQTLRVGFLLVCAGYYDYDNGYTPEFKGRDSFRGTVIHPQHWPEGLDYSGKRVVVIGSGATAVTLVPSMAAQAAKVTMLQRSPSYVMSRPAEDAIANWAREKLPAKTAYSLVRWKNVTFGTAFYNYCKRFPAHAKKLLVAGVKQSLGSQGQAEAHFSPSYGPWDQRLCLVPDADLFEAMKAGKAEVVTDHIDSFVPEGILLKSGKTLPADIIVTATGLSLKLMGGIQLAVDGRVTPPQELLVYKGSMASGIPNLAMTVGYTNASWTLKCELTIEYVCRLLNYMDKHGYREARPDASDPTLQSQPIIDFSSGYVQRAMDRLPRQGSRKPWKLYQNYLLDLLTMRHAKVEDPELRFLR